MAVPIDGTGTASVAPVMTPPVPGVQKPSHRVQKRFRESLVAAPEGKVKKPAGLKMSEIRLFAAGPPGRKPGGMLWCHGLPGVASAPVQALRWLTAMTSSWDPSFPCRWLGLLSSVWPA